jgi:glycine dehydrogenase
MLPELEHPDHFHTRHNGIRPQDEAKMLQTIGESSLADLINHTVPAGIRLSNPLHLPEPMTEHELLAHLRTVAGKNKLFKSYIGLGYYNTFTPPVIQRNILENPGWYTQYTPYQAEIAQGRLEALLNFQTMVSDLTGMEIANASLLDEATAAAEAMTMIHALTRDKNSGQVFLVGEDVHPQTIAVLQTRANPLGIQVEVVSDIIHHNIPDGKYFGALLQYPATDGNIYPIRSFIEKAHSKHMLVAVATDLLALTLLTPPGEFGADVVVGSAQRFGIPLGYGGPHPAFFATRDDYKRLIPGRLVGVSIDAMNRPAYRLTLQTREQHIRREKATSNICTAQVLLAVMAGMYAVYHGPEGLKAIAQRVYKLTRITAKALQKLGYHIATPHHFDTIKIDLADNAGFKSQELNKRLEEAQINLRMWEDYSYSISIDETTTFQDVEKLVNIFAQVAQASKHALHWEELVKDNELTWSDELIRKSDFLTHPVFNTYRSETEMLRYIKMLESRDLSLTTSMIPLGSCTMKLNATAEMYPVSYREFSALHPFVPVEQAQGYLQILDELSKYLCEITGFHAVSLQPNSGAQGEYAGLMVIREYFRDHGQGHRNVALIPASAHGTNPASAVLAGMEVIVVKSDAKGYIDLVDLEEKAVEHKDKLAALMVTYPSTHGVYEESIRDVCNIIHQNGGLVYMDGANMNAQVGLTNPANIGADVCHLNLHKTFCIPHGGGGPGMGPIGVVEKLAPYLPTHPLVPNVGGAKGISPVSAAPFGSASILLISYAYIRMMGGKGLTKATELAILNANYIRARLEPYFPVLYKGTKGTVAHELILDFRPFKMKAGIEVEDIAKRLMDYSFHAPTVSFPVPGTMMIEPTESESLAEIDRFCEAMILIAGEIAEVVDGIADKKDNVLKNAPHTAEMLTAEEWKYPYSREKAAYPARWLRSHKFWTPVARINNSYGDRNVVCACPPIESYMTESVKAEAVTA